MPNTSSSATLPGPFRLDFTVRPGDDEQLELWRFALSPMHAMELRDPAARDRFEVGITSYQFADVAISKGFSSASRFERTVSTIARTDLDNICVIVHRVGGFELSAEGEAVEVAPGDICLLDLSRPSALRTVDYANLAAILPRALIAPLTPNLDALHGLIIKGTNPLSAILIDHLSSLFRQAPALGPSDARAAAHGTTALVSSFAGAVASGREGTACTAAMTNLHRVRRLIEDNLTDPQLGPAFLSRRVGMSRASLYRLFEPIGGIQEYIQKRRLTRAFQMIVDPVRAHTRIGAIAASCGFPNDSVFSRAFKTTYGLSPTDLRSASGQRIATEFAHAVEPPFVTMNRWLVGMNSFGR